MKNRLLILVNNFPNRSETFVLQHVYGMMERGYDVTVLSNKGDQSAWDSTNTLSRELRGRVINFNMPTGKTSRMIGIIKILCKNLVKGRYKYFKSLNFFKFGKSSVSLLLPYVYDKVLDLGEYDLIHCHFGPVGVIGAHLKELGSSKKLIVTFHGYDVSMILKNDFHNPYEKLFKISDLILTVSDRWMNKLSAMGAPTERIQVHRVGVDLSKFSFKQQPIIKSKSLKIVTTARCVEKKGLKYGIEAISIVKEKLPDLDISYDLIGDGPLFEQLLSLAKELKVSDVIKFHGSKSHEDVEAILRSSDLFMLPSVTAANGDQEGIPVAIMEAMAIGLVVISTNHSGIPELVDHGKNGYLVSERDSAALAEGIIYLATHLEKLSFMRAAGREKVESNHDLKVQNDSLVEQYEQLLNCK